MARWRATSRFLTYLKRLDRASRERVEQAIKRFELDPSHPGLRLEKLGGGESAWSIRVAGGDRILLTKMRDDQGEVWIIEDAGPHDVYRRLRR